MPTPAPLLALLASWPAWDTQLLRWLNAQHAPWLDPAMLALTDPWGVLPAVAVGLWGWWRQYGPALWRPLLLALALLALTDALSSRVLKPALARPRPCATQALQPQLHTPGNRCTGAPSFPSSHATNAMGLAALVLGLGGWAWPGWVFWLGWALLHAYTRVYLGLHYPLDLLGGFALGGGLGTALAWMGRRTKLVPKRPPAGAS